MYRSLTFVFTEPIFPHCADERFAFPSKGHYFALALIDPHSGCLDFLPRSTRVLQFSVQAFWMPATLLYLMQMENVMTDLLANSPLCPLLFRILLLVLEGLGKYFQHTRNISKILLHNYIKINLLKQYIWNVSYYFYARRIWKQRPWVVLAQDLSLNRSQDVCRSPIVSHQENHLTMETGRNQNAFFITLSHNVSISIFYSLRAGYEVQPKSKKVELLSTFGGSNLKPSINLFQNHFGK